MDDTRSLDCAPAGWKTEGQRVLQLPVRKVYILFTVSISTDSAQVATQSAVTVSCTLAVHVPTLGDVARLMSLACHAVCDCCALPTEWGSSFQRVTTAYS